MSQSLPKTTQQRSRHNEAFQPSKKYFPPCLIAFFPNITIYLKTGLSATPVMSSNQNGCTSKCLMPLRKSEGRMDKFTNETLSSIPQNNLRYLFPLILQPLELYELRWSSVNRKVLTFVLSHKFMCWSYDQCQW